MVDIQTMDLMRALQAIQDKRVERDCVLGNIQKLWGDKLIAMNSDDLLTAVAVLQSVGYMLPEPEPEPHPLDAGAEAMYLATIGSVSIDAPGSYKNLPEKIKDVWRARTAKVLLAYKEPYFRPGEVFRHTPGVTDIISAHATCKNFYRASMKNILGAYWKE